MILGVIVVSEIAFRVVIIAGLLARYVARAPRLGVFLLALAPVIDLMLLVTTAADLHSGSVASWHHGLAALYIGFSIAYGHRIIGWADVRVAHFFSGRPAPVRLHGWAHTGACWRDVLRTGLAVTISAGLIWSLSWWVGDPERTSALDSWYPIMLLVAAIEVVWAISYTISPKKNGSPPRMRLRP